MADDKIVLALYVAGSTLRSERAIANIHRILSDFLDANCEVRIIDVLEDPESAETARVMATPTLVRETPAPERRIIGDLSDTKAVLRSLDLPGKTDNEKR